jgi:NADPH:quinone reductase-like Zn-dependent oxidoreductase
LGDHTAEEGASAYINPMTALGFVETAKADGAKAILHTVGASNLGQMLTRICLEDGIELVNIVRKAEHVDLLKGQGAKHVINASDSDFFEQLTDAIRETGAFCGLTPSGAARWWTRPSKQWSGSPMSR